MNQNAGSRTHTGLLPQHVQDVSLDLNYTPTEVKPTLTLSAKAAKWIK